MTVETALAKLQFFEVSAAKKKKKLESGDIEQKLNELLAPVAKRSQQLELHTNSLIDVLLALLENTEYTTEVVVCGPHLSLEGRTLVSDVFAFGKDPGRFNVWFERRPHDGKQILCFSLKTPGL